MNKNNYDVIPIVLGVSLGIAAVGYGALSTVWNTIKNTSNEKACDLYRLSPEGQKAETQVRSEAGFKPQEYSIKTPQGIACRFN